MLYFYMSVFIGQGHTDLESGVPTSGVWVDIEMDRSWACAIHESSAVACWGSDSFGQVSHVP